MSVTLHSTTLTVEQPDDTEIEITEIATEDDWLDLPTLADVGLESGQTNTGSLITRLWEAVEESETLEPGEAWEPEEFSEVAASNRVFRWPVVLGAIGLLIGIIVAVQVVGALPSNETAEMRDAHLQASDRISAALPGTEGAAQALGDGSISSADLSEAAVALADLDQAARSAFDVAAAELPDGPLAESDPALAGMQANLRSAAEQSIGLERRLGELFTYRLLFDKAFILPELPEASPAGNIPALGVELSLAIADSAEAIRQLPEDPILANHRSAAISLIDRLDTWQVEYLAALRNRDAEESARLIEEADVSVAALIAAIDPSLRDARRWAMFEIQEISEALIRIETLAGSQS